MIEILCLGVKEHQYCRKWQLICIHYKSSHRYDLLEYCKKNLHQSFNTPLPTFYRHHFNEHVIHSVLFWYALRHSTPSFLQQYNLSSSLICNFSNSTLPHWHFYIKILQKANVGDLKKNITSHK